MELTEFEDRFIKQLNTLIPFIQLGNREVFGLLRKNPDIYFGESDYTLCDQSAFHQIVIESSIMLAYSYFEAFLKDLAQYITMKNPGIMNDAGLQMNCSEILGVYSKHGQNGFPHLLTGLVNKYIDKRADRCSNALDFCVDKLNIQDAHNIRIIKAMIDLRHAIVHNPSEKQEKQREVLRVLKNGNDRILTETHLNSCGAAVRQLVSQFINQAQHLNHA